MTSTGRISSDRSTPPCPQPIATPLTRIRPNHASKRPALTEPTSPRPPGRERRIADGVLGLDGAAEDHGREPVRPVELGLEKRAERRRLVRHEVAPDRDRQGTVGSIHPRLHLTTSRSGTFTPGPAADGSDAYHRRRCASTSSPEPRSRSASTSCGRSRTASSTSAWRASAGARPGWLPTARSGRTATSAPSATIRPRADLGATETTSAARPSPPSVQAVDPPAAPTPSHSTTRPGGSRSATTATCATSRRPARRYQDQGRITGRADTEVGARWLEDAWAAARRPAPAPDRAACDRSAARPTWRSSTADGTVVAYAGNTREPGLHVPTRAGSGSSSTGALLDRPVALPVRRAGRDRRRLIRPGETATLDATGTLQSA